jgi:Flp pilus assembly protein TadD
MGMPEAQRAIYYAPSSPVPLNTLGTLLLKLGQLAEARTAFDRALKLNPEAPYILSNLCYVMLLEGESAQAIERCHSALRIQPGLQAARNNLAMAYAASGDWAAASREFGVSGNQAWARYNMGVTLLAARRFSDAAGEFDAAALLRPDFSNAHARARQARTLAARAASENAYGSAR